MSQLDTDLKGKTEDVQLLRSGVMPGDKKGGGEKLEKTQGGSLKTVKGSENLG